MDTDTANALVREHLPLVRAIVGQVAASFPSHVDRGELWNAGAYGLVEASRRYDPATGVPFARYAALRIRGAIIDSTRTRDFSTRGVRRRARELQQATDRLRADLGRPPTDEELAGALERSPAEVDRIRAEADAGTVLQLDRLVQDEGDEGTSLGDLITETDRELLPEAHLEHRDTIGLLRTAIALLPDRQREVIERYYLAGELLRDIAEHHGVSEARVSQIRREAVAAIRDAFVALEPDGALPDTGDRRAAWRDGYVDELCRTTTWHERLRAADAPMVA